MKKNLVILFILFPSTILGQNTFNKPTISNAGEKSTFSGGSFTWTIGETAVGTISGTNVVFLQGFAPTNLTVATPPTPPAIGSITQPTCALATGSVVLNGLPATGIWTLTKSPGGSTTTGTGTSTTISGLAAGTYTYTVTDANNLTSSPSSNIVINTQPSTPTAPVVGTITQPTCVLATGSVILNGLPAVDTWTLTVSPGGTTVTGTGTSKTISGLAAGTYTYTVTNSSNCVSVASANIVINAQPSTPTAPVVGTITQPTCALATGSVVLSGLPSTGTWTLTKSPGGATSTGSGTSTTISGLAAGTYTYTVTNSASCTSVSSGNIVINTQPSTPSAPVVGTITQPTCALATGSVVLSGLPSSGSWTLTKSPGGTTSTGSGSSTTLAGLSAGTYTYTVTNSSSCISTASNNVVINTQPETPTAPSIGTITQPTCDVSTGSVVLNGLPSSGTWTLTKSPGGATTTGSGTSTTISGLAAGTYTYTITNSSSCVSVSSGNIVINTQPSTPTAPVIGTITQPTCAVSTGSVALSGLPSSGSWTVTRSPGGVTTTGSGTTGTITGISPGTYTFIVTNASTCSSAPSSNAVLNTPVGAPSSPQIGTITHPTCLTITGSVVLTGLPSSGTWTITKNFDGSTVNGSGTSTTVAGLAPGTHTFSVTGTSGCISAPSPNAVVNNPPSPPSSPIPGTIIHPTCSVATGSVTLSGLPATGTWTLTRSPGNITSGGSSTSTVITDIPAGTYSYTVTNSAGCTSAASTDVIVNPQPETPSAPSFGSVTQPDCSQSTGSAVLTGLPSTGTWTLTTYPGSATISGSGNSKTINSLTAGTYTFTVTNESGCTSSSSGNLVINAQPSTPSAPITGTVTHPTCSLTTGSVTLSGLPASGNWTITRSPGAVNTIGSGTSVTVSGIPAGTYTFIVTNSTGCPSASSSGVVINSQPPLPASPTTGSIVQPTCIVNTGSVVVSGLPAGTWTLSRSPGGNITGSGNSVNISNLSPGTYTFSVTNQDGCISPNSASITLNQPDPGKTPAIVPKWQGAVLVVNNFENAFRRYQWYKDGIKLANDTLQYIVVKNLPGIYSIQATDLNGCRNFSSPFTATLAKSLTAYPNPATETINLEFDGDNKSRVTMILYNSLGVKMMEVKGENMDDPLFKNIDISQYEKGTYIIKVMFENSELYYSKLVKIDK